ncbi:MAG TPA: hypothetical protein VGL33_26435 [Streptosporangiaceae bacterium]
MFDAYPQATLILGHRGELRPFHLARFNRGNAQRIFKLGWFLLSALLRSGLSWNFPGRRGLPMVEIKVTHQSKKRPGLTISLSLIVPAAVIAGFLANGSSSADNTPAPTAPATSVEQSYTQPAAPAEGGSSAGYTPPETIDSSRYDPPRLSPPTFDGSGYDPVPLTPCC